VLTGFDMDIIVQSVATVTDYRKKGKVPLIPVDYLNENVSQRVVNLIIGTARLSNEWDGLRKLDYN